MDFKEGIIILTEKGKEELKTPKSLKMEERSILVMIDCCSTGKQLLDKARGYPNAEHILDKLIRDDYLAVTTEVPKQETQRTLHEELRKTAVDLLGSRADEVVKKLDSAPIDKEALLQVVRQVKQIVYLTIDERKAVLLENALKKVVEKYLK